MFYLAYKCINQTTFTSNWGWPPWSSEWGRITPFLVWKIQFQLHQRTTFGSIEQKNHDFDATLDTFFNLDVDQYLRAPALLMFPSFSSAKDSNYWQRHPKVGYCWNHRTITDRGQVFHPYPWILETNPKRGTVTERISRTKNPGRSVASFVYVLVLWILFSGNRTRWRSLILAYAIWY